VVNGLGGGRGRGSAGPTPGISAGRGLGLGGSTRKMTNIINHSLRKILSNYILQISYDDTMMTQICYSVLSQGPPHADSFASLMNEPHEVLDDN
jgi:hypothetical protein